MTHGDEGHASLAQPGLFSPGSVSRRVHAHPAMWLAGVRALYLQALHPQAVRGVLQNSSFRRDPVGRLARTARFVAVVTYGRRDVAERAAARVRRIHSGLRGSDPETGESFRVNDPALLLWVHCASVSSYLTVVRRAGLRLSDRDADAYLDEQRISAALVGLAREQVPADAGAMARYFESARPGLRLTAEPREIFTFLTSPPMPPGLRQRLAPLGAAGGWMYQGVSHQSWRRLSLVAYSALPPWAIAMYRRAPYPASVTSAALRTLSGGAGLAPRRWRARLLGT